MQRKPIYTDTHSRFRSGTTRQAAYVYVRHFLADNETPRDFGPLMFTVKAQTVKEAQRFAQQLCFVIGSHLDVFRITEDNRLTTWKEQPVPEARKNKTTPIVLITK